MRPLAWVGIIGVLLGFAAVAGAQDPVLEILTVEETTSPGSRPLLVQQPGDVNGISTAFGLTQIYQQTVRGGLSTGAREGRYAGSYEIAAEADLGRFLNTRETRAFLLVEGGWPDAGGIDPVSVGSYFGVNGDALPSQSVGISELWLRTSLFRDRAYGRIGKLDLTGTLHCPGCEAAFDGNRYANDETSQFLNGALVNNPTIPFPDRTLGVGVFGIPWQFWHVRFALAARGRDGQNESWASFDDGLFGIVEGSLLSAYHAGGRRMLGEYRIGGWVATEGQRPTSARQRGLYLSAAQPLYREYDDPDDREGLSLLVRAGWTAGPGAVLDEFYSIGVQYEGLFSGRRADVLGLAFAHGAFAGGADPDVPEGNEAVWELYYHVAVAHWMSVSPDLQYVANPGGRHGSKDALVMGLRAHIWLD